MCVKLLVAERGQQNSFLRKYTESAQNSLWVRVSADFNEELDIQSKIIIGDRSSCFS